jgi:hypothetical protein
MNFGRAIDPRANQISFSPFSMPRQQKAEKQLGHIQVLSAANAAGNQSTVNGSSVIHRSGPTAAHHRPLTGSDNTLTTEDGMSRDRGATFRTCDSAKAGFVRSPSIDPMEELPLLKDKSAVEEVDEEELGPPKDHYRLTYLILFLLGTGMLFPWNVFINARDYFKIRFTGSSYADNFSNFFAIGFMISNVIWLGVALKTQQQVFYQSKLT